MWSGFGMQSSSSGQDHYIHFHTKTLEKGMTLPPPQQLKSKPWLGSLSIGERQQSLKLAWRGDLPGYFVRETSTHHTPTALMHYGTSEIKVIVTKFTLEPKYKKHYNYLTFNLNTAYQPIIWYLCFDSLAGLKLLMVK